jgi:hypothetical protein
MDGYTRASTCIHTIETINSYDLFFPVIFFGDHAYPQAVESVFRSG